MVATEKAERALALAVAEKAGRGLTPTVENTGEDVTMQVVLNTWGARKYKEAMVNTEMTTTEYESGYEYGGDEDNGGNYNEGGEGGNEWEGMAALGIKAVAVMAVVEHNGK